MTKQLATICLAAMFLIGIAAPSVRGQDSKLKRATLKGINAVQVLVESLPVGATTLGLTAVAIQTDVELKLRLAGIRVVTEEESMKLPGMPLLDITVNLTDSGRAASIDVELEQNVLLERNGESAVATTTWAVGTLLANPSAEYIRNNTKDLVDKFLNAWLSVNPKK